jgi:hypothetical protein
MGFGIKSLKKQHKGQKGQGAQGARKKDRGILSSQLPESQRGVDHKYSPGKSLHEKKEEGVSAPSDRQRKIGCQRINSQSGGNDVLGVGYYVSLHKKYLP